MVAIWLFYGRILVFLWSHFGRALLLLWSYLVLLWSYFSDVMVALAQDRPSFILLLFSSYHSLP